MLICLTPAVAAWAEDPTAAGPGPFETLQLPRLELRAPLAPPAPLGGFGRPALGATLETSLSVGDPRSFRGSGNRFVEDYLTPRLSRQMDVIAPAHPVLLASDEMVDYIFYDELSNSAERRARRGVRRAVGDYFIETTSLQSLIGSVKSKSDKASTTKGAFDLGFGASHWLPEVELRYNKPHHSVRFRVGLHGSAGITFQHEKMTRTRLNFGWDADDDAVDLSLRFGF
jgi:hypothetical protein